MIFEGRKKLLFHKDFFLSKNEKNCDHYRFWKFQAALG